MSAGEEQVAHQEGRDAVDAVLQGLPVFGYDRLLVTALPERSGHIRSLPPHAVRDGFQHLYPADILAIFPEGLVGGMVKFHDLAVLLGVLCGFQRVEGVGSVRRRSHDQPRLPGLPSQWFRQFVLSLPRPGRAFRAFPGSVRAKEVGTPFHFDFEFLSQLVDPFQADITPRSNVVIPDGHPD